VYSARFFVMQLLRDTKHNLDGWISSSAHRLPMMSINMQRRQSAGLVAMRIRIGSAGLSMLELMTRLSVDTARNVHPHRAVRDSAIMHGAYSAQQRGIAAPLTVQHQ